MLTAMLVAVLLAACSAQDRRADTVTLTFVGTNDIHGQLGAAADHGGLVEISAYVEALRAARAADGGGVAVIDAGDIFQGSLESNLTEGASMVEAYNALGVAAAAIGNHEFDFGPAGPDAIPRNADQDARSALKARAREAAFPLLAANIIDDATGQPVAWDNVQPSTMIDVAGIPVGVIGVSTVDTLATTIAANTRGLSIAPLAPAVTREAKRLREQGAVIVIVTAHAGGRCRHFGDPDALGRCGLQGELADLANALEPGLVNHVFGGHLGEQMAETINGVSVSMNYGKGIAFGRVDFIVDRNSGTVRDSRLFPPQINHATLPPTYEGQSLAPAPNVVAVAATAMERAQAVRDEPLGVSLDEPFGRSRDMESAIYNLFVTALYESFDVDIAMHNVQGGLRADLPAGPLTFGDIYEMYPFDNFVQIFDVSGLELRKVIAAQSKWWRRPAFAGLRVDVACDDRQMTVRLLRDDGSEIRDDDRVRLLVNDYLALGGDRILAPLIPPGGLALQFDQPLMRDVVVDWLRQRPGEIRRADWRSDDAPKWTPPDIIPGECEL